MFLFHRLTHAISIFSYSSSKHQLVDRTTNTNIQIIETILTCTFTTPTCHGLHLLYLTSIAITHIYHKPNRNHVKLAICRTNPKLPSKSLQSLWQEHARIAHMPMPTEKELHTSSYHTHKDASMPMKTYIYGHIAHMHSQLQVS